MHNHINQNVIVVMHLLTFSFPLIQKMMPFCTWTSIYYLFFNSWARHVSVEAPKLLRNSKSKGPNSLNIFADKKKSNLQDAQESARTIIIALGRRWDLVVNDEN